MRNPRFQLGRRKSPPDRKGRELRLRRYLLPGLLPSAPVSVDYGAKVSAPWGEMLNDVEGDCTVAGAGHSIMVWTANGKGLYVPPDADIQSAYRAIGGFNPADPEDTDNGCVPDDVLKYWRDYGISGHKIGAWVAPDPKRQDEMSLGLYLAGALYLGLELPDAVLEGDTPPPWAIPAGQENAPAWQANPENGHMVMATAYDPSGLTVITWGQAIHASWEFIAAFCDEPYVVLSTDLLNGSGLCPAGFDLPTLQADLQRITTM